MSSSGDSQQKRTFNPSNILVTKDDIEEILHKYGVDKSVSKLGLWQRAFAHPSYCVNGGGKKRYQRYTPDPNEFESTGVPLQRKSYERLEWRGDKVIDNAVSAYLFKRYKRQDEGFLTKTRSKLVRKDALADLSRKIGLAKYLLIAEYLEIDSNGRDNENNLEDCFEAFVGAMIEEFDDDRLCYTFIVNVIEEHVDMAQLIMRNNNHKDTLMRYYQKNYDGVTPVYEVLIDEETGRPAGPPFTAWVLDPTGKKRVGMGQGPKRQKAQQEAAKAALKYYRVKSV